MFSCFHVYYHNGVIHKTYISTAGTHQGCVSATWFYAIATLLTAKKHRAHSVQVADDVHIIGVENVDEVAHDYALLNQQIIGEKTCILTQHPTQTKVPDSLRNKEVTDKPVRTLGGVLIPSTKRKDEIECIKPVMLRIKQKHELLRAANTSVQVKTLILRSIQWDVLYYAQVFPPSFAEPFFTLVDEETLNTFIQLTGIEKSVLTHQFNLPLEVGGLGFLPWQLISILVRQQNLVKCHNICSIAKLRTPAAPPTNDMSMPSIQAAWICIFKDTINGVQHFDQLSLTDRMFLKNTGFQSWMRCLPTKKEYVLSDTEFIGTLRLRLDCIKPFSYSCPISGINLESLTPSIFTKHIQSCSHCNGPLLYRRHDSCKFILKKCCSDHGIYATILKANEMPLPGNNKGGPDVIISATKLYACDVKVVGDTLPYETSSRLTSKFTTTISWYKDYANQTGLTTAPFVMNAHGIIEARTMQIIESWSEIADNKHGFINDVVMSVQFTVHRAMQHGIQILQARQTCQNLQDQSPADQEDKT